MLYPIVLSVFSLSSYGKNERSLHYVESYSTSDGLSDNTIQCIYEDSFGFLWIGTENGLNRYDGANFHAYLNEPNNPNSLCDNRVTNILEYEIGKYLIGSRQGVSVFNIHTNSFEQFDFKDSIMYESMSEINVESISKLKNGDFLLTTGYDGAFLLDKDLTSFKQLPTSLFGGKILLSSYQDENEHIWIGSRDGLFKLQLGSEEKLTSEHIIKEESHIRKIIPFKEKLLLCSNTGLMVYEKESGEIERIKSYEDYEGNTIPLNVYSATMLSETELLMALDGYGVAIFNLTEWRVMNEVVFQGLSGSNIQSVAEDRSGNVWIGTHMQGLNYYNQQTDIFSFANNEINQKTYSSRASLTSFLSISAESILVGTDGDGLYEYNPIENELTVSHKYEHLKAYIPSNKIINMVHLDQEYALFGTYGDGLVWYNKNNHEAGSVNIPVKHVKFLSKDSQGRVWVGTFGHGLFLVDLYEQLYQNDTINYTHLNPQNGFISILESKDKEIWFGTWYRPMRFNEETQDLEVISFYDDNGSVDILSSPDIIQDKEGNLWIGTMGDGIFKTTTEGKVLRHLTPKEDNLPDVFIQSMVEDDQGNIWITTKKGISAFLKDKNRLKTYTTSDGIPSVYFFPLSKEKLNTGDMIFGTGNGVLKIQPDLLFLNTRKPPVYITNISVKNKKGVQKVTSTFKLNEIVLNYEENSIELDYIALNLISPQKNQYKYKLEGFDNNWQIQNDIKSAKYTNLSPGVYTFKVIASNDDGLWNEEGDALIITIKAPFWMTSWFIVFSVILFLGVLWALYYYRTLRLRKANLDLEKRIEERTTQITVQKEEIEAQRDEILQKNKSMEDEMVVGKMLQRAMMPSSESLKKHFEESFVLYEPKYQIGGDFYYFSELDTGEFIIVAGDCSGHGVEGALQTMIAYTHLKEIINHSREYDPGKILSELNDFICATEEKNKEGYHNGVDISAIVYDPKTQNVKYAGARNQIYVIRKDNLNSIEQMEVDLFSIGLMFRKLSKKGFTTRTFNLKKGDRVYLFSDGYADQLGGPNEKKLKGSGFRKKILSIQQQELEDQKQTMKKDLAKWRGEIEQNDDIVIIGIEVE